MAVSRVWQCPNYLSLFPQPRSTAGFMDSTMVWNQSSAMGWLLDLYHGSWRTSGRISRRWMHVLRVAKGWRDDRYLMGSWCLQPCVFFLWKYQKNWFLLADKEKQGLHITGVFPVKYPTPLGLFNAVALETTRKKSITESMPSGKMRPRAFQEHKKLRWDWKK